MNENIESKMGNPEVSHEKLGITAVGVSYLRTLSDVKYAKEIYDLLKIDHLSLEDQAFMTGVKNSNLAPQVEARYKLVNRLLKESGIKQVLEIASGLSPRGLEFTDDKDFQYTEVDLQPIVLQKNKIIEDIGIRENLHTEIGNALELDSLLLATKYFDESPLAIINEGLMRYLNFDQKAMLAKNIHGLLEKFGGCWLTPDITLAKIVQSVQEDQRKRIHQLAGINITNNAFQDVAHAKSFFEGLGFVVEVHPFAEVKSELSSIRNTNIPESEIDDMLQAYVFKMTVA